MSRIVPVFLSTLKTCQPEQTPRLGIHPSFAAFCIVWPEIPLDLQKSLNPPLIKNSCPSGEMNFHCVALLLASPFLEGQRSGVVCLKFEIVLPILSLISGYLVNLFFQIGRAHV